jgi:hypothetical protein
MLIGFHSDIPSNLQKISASGVSPLNLTVGLGSCARRIWISDLGSQTLELRLCHWTNTYFHGSDMKLLVVCCLFHINDILLATFILVN